MGRRGGREPARNSPVRKQRLSRPVPAAESNASSPHPEPGEVARRGGPARCSRLLLPLEQEAEPGSTALNRPFAHPTPPRKMGLSLLLCKMGDASSWPLQGEIANTRRVPALKGTAQLFL